MPTVDVFVQIRADRQGLNEALSSGRKIKIGEVVLAAGETVALDLDFDSPRVRARSIRVLLEITTGDEDATVTLDNLQLIGWETPFAAGNAICQ